jgi:hypothetical protein
MDGTTRIEKVLNSEFTFSEPNQFRIATKRKYEAKVAVPQQ